jgi:hypothetical protein
MSPATCVLVFVLGLAQPRRVEIWREPWSHVVEILHDAQGPNAAQGNAAAQAELERLGQSYQGQDWERAYAYRWAGRLAMRARRFGDAERDFRAARALDPRGFEGRLSTVHLGEVEIQRRRWYAAERWLAQVENDPDPIVSVYARDRLRAVRERTRRLTLRYGSLALVGLLALGLAWRLARRARRPGTLRSLGRGLLLTEVLAIGGALVVPRVTTSLALSGWMAFAIPAALAGAALWATRAPSAPWWQRALVVTGFALACAAGLYLALDYTWWAVERPIL